MVSYAFCVDPLRRVQHLLRDGEYVGHDMLEAALQGQTMIPQEVRVYRDRLGRGEVRRRPGPKVPRLAATIYYGRVAGFYRYYLRRLTARKEKRGRIVGLGERGNKTFFRVTPAEIAAKLTAKLLGRDYNKSWRRIQNITYKRDKGPTG